MSLEDTELTQFVQQLLGINSDTTAVRLYLSGREELPSLDVQNFARSGPVLEKSRNFLKFLHEYWKIYERASPELNPTGIGDARLATPVTTNTLQLPNARVGVEYEFAGHVEGALVGAEVPGELGLSFDQATRKIRGIPLSASDCKFPAQWTDKQGRFITGQCALLINPDPKTLWQKLPSDPALPYQKTPEAAQLLPGKGYRVAAASRRGRSHEHVGGFRDDDYAIRCDDQTGWATLAVADGAGSAKNSREGSRIAAHRFVEHVHAALLSGLGGEVLDWLNDWDDSAETRRRIGERFHQLFLGAGNVAVDAIEEAATKDRLPVRDYSTTLLAAAVHRDGENTFVASFWVGDGAIAAYQPGATRLLGSPDGGEYAGQTKFLDRAVLSEHSFAKRVSIGRFKNLHSLLLMTDGVSDPRFETDLGLSDVTKWDNLLGELSPLLGATEPSKALIDWLEFLVPGHHDDRSIAVLW